MCTGTQIRIVPPQTPSQGYGMPEINQDLTQLAGEKNVAASKQNQA
jgi:hypothetical protein